MGNGGTGGMGMGHMCTGGMGNGAYGTIRYRGYGPHGQWEHMGQYGTGYGVQWVSATWAMRHMGQLGTGVWGTGV